MQFQKASVLIKYKPIHGKKEELIKHLIDTANNFSGNESGIEIFLVSTSPLDDNVVYLYEVYTGQPDKDKYESTPEYSFSRQNIKNLTQGAPEVIPLIPQGGKQK